MITGPTFWANIYCGLKSGYGGVIASPDLSVHICREYCDQVGLGVTVTPTKFVYTSGEEPGVIVGLINYPRFPKEPAEVKRLALELAFLLKEKLGQERVSVVMPDETVMIGKK